MSEYIAKKLHTYGLSKTEALLYIYLLEQGLSTPPFIARGTGVARTNCYNVLESLLQKGLISEQQKGKRKAYVANDPDALLRSLEKKKEDLELLVPDLRALYKTSKNKPIIQFFEGFDQVKEIYLQTLAAEQIFAIGSTKSIATIDQAFLTKYFHSLKEKNIVLQDLLTADSKEQADQYKEVLKGLYDVALLPQKIKNQPTDILIWNDNIALITLEEPIFGTIITNQLLASTFKTLFLLLFESQP